MGCLGNPWWVLCIVLSPGRGLSDATRKCLRSEGKGLGNGNPHKEQSKIPEENLEFSSAPSVPRPDRIDFVQSVT